MIKNNKGITLVALVVTIIVLLILAGITIATITNSNSAPEKAAQARDSHERATELNDIQVAVTASIKETGYNSEVDITTLKQNIGNLVTNNNLDTLITGEGPWTVTGKTGAKYQISNDGEAAWLSSKNIGDSVNYSTTRNGVILDNWKVFYKEVKDGQEYTYLIYGDYLPNNALGNISGLEKGNGNYIVKGKSRQDLINALTTKSNWSSLLKGLIDGKNIDYSSSYDDNIYAIGSPTVELWVNSWNKSYPSDKIFIRYEKNVKNNNYDGWYVSLNNPANTGSANVSQKIGYSNILYYPYTSKLDGCEGYWLSSPSSYNAGQVVQTYYKGVLGYYYGFVGPCSIRPIICFPSSALE